MGRLTLKMKLLASFLVITAILVFIFTSEAIRILDSTLREQVMQSIEANSRLSISKINEWEVRNEGDVLIFTDPYSTLTTSVIQFTEQPTAENKAAIKKALERSIFNSANFLEIYVMDKDSGKILVSTTSASEGKIEVKNDNDVYEPRTVLNTSSIEFSSRLNAYIVDIEGPIKDHLGNIVAALGAHVNIQALSVILSEHSLSGKTGLAYLVTPKGESVLSASQSFDQMKSDPNSTIKVDPSLLNDALSGKPSVREYLNSEQKLVMGYQEYLPNLGVVYVHEHDSAELLAPLKVLTQRMWVIALLIFGLSAVVGYLLINRSTRPIRLLTETAKKIAGGNYHVRAKITSWDEIGVLGNAFNQMTDSLVSTLNDISVKKALLQSQYDAAPYGIFSVGTKGEILSWNRSFYELWDAPSCLLKKENVSQLFSECSIQAKQADDFVRRMMGLYKENKISHDIIEMTNGKIIEWQSMPLTTEDGKALGKIFFVRDITKETEVNKTKNEFVSIASHQLQTPLTAMNWLLENLLQMEKEDKGKYEIVKDAHNSALRMTRLVNDLLNVTRLDAGLISVNSKKMDLVQSVKELLIKAKIVAGAKKIELHFEEPKKEFVISADKILIENVILNLLSNAIRFSDPKKTITVSIKQVRKMIEICVKDQGIGISKEDQRNLFNKFFRTASAARYNTSGSGLGMYVVKKILELCKGDIKVESQVGKGSIFTISLPLKGPVTKKEGAKGLILQDISKL